MSDKHIRVIVFREGDCWLGQGLEHDICVQAATLDEVYGRFEVAVKMEAAEPGGLDRIGEAPKHFFGLWDRRSSEIKPSSDGNPNHNYGMAA